MKDPILKEKLISVTKESISEALQDQGFLAEMVRTVTKGSILAVQDKEATAVIVSALKESLVEALQDEGFMTDMVGTLSKAAIQASQNRHLKDSLLEVTKDSVTEALKDEAFMKAFRFAMQGSLGDSGMYRAAAGGVVSALNPFSRRGAED